MENNNYLFYLLVDMDAYFLFNDDMYYLLVIHE